MLPGYLNRLVRELRHGRFFFADADQPVLVKGKRALHAAPPCCKLHGMASDTAAPRYTSFRAFYPFYLSQHRDLTCRRLHVVGSSLVLALLATCLVSGQWAWLLALPLVGYGFAWVGHFRFERNRPATFEYPLYSFMGDWLMFWQVLTRRVPL